MKRPWIAFLVVLGPTMLGLSLLAQDMLPPLQLQGGPGNPPAWYLGEGQGDRQSGPPSSPTILQVRGRGNDSAYWRTTDIRFDAGGLYAFRFTGRRLAGSTGGTAVSGPSRVNRDFPLSETWATRRFVFRMPDGATNDFVRLGQWHAMGEVQFCQPELLPVWARHRVLGDGLELGEAESIENGVYRFQPDFGWTGANAHRPLANQRAGFNSNRWLFSPGAAIIYRHRIGTASQQRASVRVAINHHLAGTLRVEASRDGQSWLMAGEFDGLKRGGLVDLPAELFPAAQVYVRLSQVGAGEGFQVDTYEYQAPLEGTWPALIGHTDFLELRQSDPHLPVTLDRLTRGDADALPRLEVAVGNHTGEPQTVTAEWTDGREPVMWRGAERTPLAAHAETRFRFQPTELGAGEWDLRFRLRTGLDRARFEARLPWRVSFLEDASFGYRLAGSSGLNAWWCESGWKIGRTRSLPPVVRGQSRGRIRVSAARGEYEAVQVVLRPREEAVLTSAKVTAFQRGSDRSSPLRVDLAEVAYVNITRPTDGTGTRGWHPDPLPHLALPLPLQANQNQPLWLTFEVLPQAQPGEYRGELRLETTLGSLRLPISVEVYDFALPRETHLRSALGLGASSLNPYHQLTSRADQAAVFEQYLANFARHRISPYSFYDYAPIGLRFEGEGDQQRAKLDFAGFDDAARRWLDEGAFSTFQLPVRGMGGGTFHSRHLGELAGYQEGTPEHARLFRDYLSQVEAHLRERDWLRKAFVYWFDEPDPKDYEFVIAGMRRLHDAAPGIRRMLTEQPEPELAGHVDIWCGLTPEWTPEKVRARREAGEEVWWYICTAPKAPYVTQFIDHPGTEMRLWPWQSWQYGVTGILIWATTYWTSPLAYPNPTLQDPWSDPMSWVTGYGNPVGTRSPWGNGDGRLLYPPRRDSNASAAPCLDGPIHSLRWENLRDGMEDYEYLWLLEQEVKRTETRHGHTSPWQAARGLLRVPDNISRDLTHFTTDPRPILEHRHRVARMIEHLRRLK
jgi:hypothetical protein